jgi:hypothetical protein
MAPYASIKRLRTADLHQQEIDKFILSAPLQCRNTYLIGLSGEKGYWWWNGSNTEATYKNFMVVGISPKYTRNIVVLGNYGYNGEFRWISDELIEDVWHCGICQKGKKTLSKTRS